MAIACLNRRLRHTRCLQPARIIVCPKAVACPRTVYTWPCQDMVLWNSPAHVPGEVLDRLYDLTIGRV